NVSGKLIHPTAKDSRTIDSRIGGALIHSRNGYSLFRVGSRGNRELLVIRPDGSWRPLLPVDNGSTTEQGFVVPGHGEPTFLVRSDHLAEHFRLLKVTHTEHGSSVDVLLERDDAELEEFAVSTDGSTLAVLWNVQGWCDLEIYRLTPDGVHLLCAPAMPSLIATEPSLTADGRFLALGVSGPEFPPSVVLFDVAEQHWVGEDFSPIASPIGEVVSASLIAEQKLADAPCCINNAPRDQRGNDVLSVWGQAQIIPQLLHFEARDGLGLSGWFYHAVGVPDGGVAPTFVYFHGGPEGQSRPDYNNVLRKVVQAGYHVFMPNVRGSSGFGRKFSQADDRYARFAAIDDAEDALNFLIDQGFTREGEAVIAGRSYGGFLVHSSLTRHAGRWKGGIAACGMSDLLTFYRDTDPWIASAAQPKYGDPNLDTHLLREASPLRQLSRVKVPVLFVHGELDSNVPVSEAYQAMGVLAGHGIDVELLLFSNEGHVFEKLTNRYDMARRVLDFCERLFTA
ncbi:MAG: prolyl oligopeptidase family serine peptidase, partial [Corynebacterium sp.]|nr:prolyl oligopeptidase family serine peptidase [Corynebacterium sp.]